MDIHVYTTPHDYPDEAYWINTLFDCGMGNLRIYKPSWSKKKLLNLLNEIDFYYYPQIIIHAFDFLVSEEPVYGFHFSRKFIQQTDRPEVLLRMCGIQECGQKVSISMPDIEKYDTDFFDYADRVVLSPIYPSLSKENHLPNYSLERYQQLIKQHTDKQFLGLGGVTLDKLDEMEAVGFYGAAFLSYVWHTPNKTPLQQLQKIYGNDENL